MTSHSTSEDGASTPWYGTVNCPSREQALSLIGNVQGDYVKTSSADEEDEMIEYNFPDFEEPTASDSSVASEVAASSAMAASDTRNRRPLAADDLGDVSVDAIDLDADAPLTPPQVVLADKREVLSSPVHTDDEMSDALLDQPEFKRDKNPTPADIRVMMPQNLEELDNATLERLGYQRVTGPTHGQRIVPRIRLAQGRQAQTEENLKRIRERPFNYFETLNNAGFYNKPGKKIPQPPPSPPGQSTTKDPSQIALERLIGDPPDDLNRSGKPPGFDEGGGRVPHSRAGSEELTPPAFLRGGTEPEKEFASKTVLADWAEDVEGYAEVKRRLQAAKAIFQGATE